MGWRRRHRSRPARCSAAEYRRAYEHGYKAVSAFVKACGIPAGIKGARKRARRK